MKRFALSSIVLALAALSVWAAASGTPMPELISPDFLDTVAEHVELDAGQRGTIKSLLDDSVPGLRADWKTLRELERQADEVRERLIKSEGKTRAAVRESLRDKKQRKRFDRLVRSRSKVRESGLKRFLFGSGEGKPDHQELYEKEYGPGISMNED
ncbi:MAG: hypothetical protein V3S11_00825 [Elusimicrobiota bacterium]